MELYLLSVRLRIVTGENAADSVFCNKHFVELKIDIGKETLMIKNQMNLKEYIRVIEILMC